MLFKDDYNSRNAGLSQSILNDMSMSLELCISEHCFVKEIDRYMQFLRLFINCLYSPRLYAYVIS